MYVTLQVQLYDYLRALLPFCCFFFLLVQKFAGFPVVFFFSPLYFLLCWDMGLVLSVCWVIVLPSVFVVLWRESGGS